MTLEYAAELCGVIVVAIVAAHWILSRLGIRRA
jgi:flagellar biosynthesis protein FliQ